MYCAYNIIQESISELYQRKPISCIMTSLYMYYAIKEGSMYLKSRGVELKFSNTINIPDLCMSFHTFTIDESTTEFYIDVINKN